MSKINRVIQYFRSLREEGGAPTMNTGTLNGSSGFSSNADSSGPNAGFDPVMGFRKRRNGKIDGRSTSNKYKKWLKSLGLL